MADTTTPPYDVLPCPYGDVILIPRGQLAIRLTPEQQRELAELLLAPRTPQPDILSIW
ncbi:hypothetical protein [Streptosporangium saharense]|uniref:hypothetical protein n=1 Tax=Streptosporangium saharense TaxID=1706840 RepID=UPI00331F9442